MQKNEIKKKLNFIMRKLMKYYIFLGQSTKGIIIGYGNPIKNYKGIESYPYKIKYKYNGKEYIVYYQGS